jgi:predicted outer membrane repeat protein
VTITSSTFSDNSAGNGGGISAEFSRVTITSSTFSGNSAGTNGGGIFNNRDGTVTITSSTFSGNSAGAMAGALSTMIRAPPRSRTASSPITPPAIAVATSPTVAVTLATGIRVVPA